MNPLIFINKSEYFAIDGIFFSNEANIANIIIITHCPIAKQNRSKIANIMFLVIAAIAIIVNNMGVEQGLDANANTQPTIKGYKKVLPDLFFGISFINDGKLMSKKPIRFKPNKINKDAKIKIKRGEATPVKALPVNAHKTPMILKTVANPNEKNNICANNFLFPSLE